MLARLLRRWFAKPPASPPAGGTWTPVARVADIKPGRLEAVIVDGTQIAIGRDGKRWFAVQRRCPHRFGDLAAGKIDRGALVCPDHKYRFSLTTGRHDGTTDHCLVRYAVRVVGDTVEIDLSPLPAA
jgi:nitrite reductase/ring-hydroxylating ferredoxin subunit